MPPPVIQCLSIIYCITLTVQCVPAGQDSRTPTSNHDTPSGFAADDPSLSPSQHSFPHTAQPKEAPTPDPESPLAAEDTILSLNQPPSPHPGQPQEVPTHHGESKNDDHGTKVKKTLPKLPPDSMAARANAIVGLHIEQYRDGQGY